MATRRDSGRNNNPLVHSAQEPVDCQPQSPSRPTCAYQLFRDRGKAADSLLRKAVVTSRRRLIRFEPPLATRPDYCVLADCKKLRRSACADQGGAAGQLGRRRAGQSLDFLEPEAVVAAGRGFSRLQCSPRNRAENCCLAHAKAIGCLPRTDQCVQDMCWNNAAL